MPAETNRPTIVIAHRGASAAAPENTAAAFGHALTAGVDAIETDIRVSRDGVPVLFHDQDLMRVANSRSKVTDLTAAELASVDVGAWMGPAFSGQGVPTLAWLAERCQPNTSLLLDLKVEGSAAAIAEALKSTGFPADRAYLCAWTEDQATDIRTHLPDTHMVYIEEATPHDDQSWIQSVALRGYDSMSLDHASLDSRTVREAHAHGLTVFTWTVNNPSDIQRVQDMGVDGIICDGTPAGEFPLRRRGC